MKIAELFYPKELKEIIADLRAKDDLNVEALKPLNKEIYILLCVAAPLLYMTYSSIGFFIILIVTPFVVWYTAKEHYKKYMVPYINDQKLAGVVSDLQFYVYRTIKYYIYIPSKNVTYQIDRMTDWQKIHRPKINDPMTIYINPKRQDTAMPDHPYFKTKYQLQRSKLNSQRKS